MKIASGALQMDAQHSEQQSGLVKSSLRSWSTDRSAAAAAADQTAVAASSPVQISDAAKAAQAGEISAIQQSIDEVENDPMLRMIRMLVAMLSGKELKDLRADTLEIASPASAEQTASQPATPVAAQQSTQPAQQSAGFGVEYTRHESYSESEQTSFAASGVVNTADGKQISFSLALSMSRSYHEESTVSIRFGDAPPVQDPLVVNFDGNAAQLTDQRFAFDLDADGDQERINFVAGGSGFLALDRNGDRQINDGSELFGARTGDGFAELAALDSDQNGWIDENDAAYKDLRIWTKDANGADRLSTLADADVGALALAHVATPFDVKDADNELQGKIRSSGVFLRDSGTVGTLQQIDLTV